MLVGNKLKMSHINCLKKLEIEYWMQ